MLLRRSWVRDRTKREIFKHQREQSDRASPAKFTIVGKHDSHTIVMPLIRAEDFPFLRSWCPIIARVLFAFVLFHAFSGVARDVAHTCMVVRVLVLPRCHTSVPGGALSMLTIAFLKKQLSEET